MSEELVINLFHEIDVFIWFDVRHRVLVLFCLIYQVDSFNLYRVQYPPANKKGS